MKTTIKLITEQTTITCDICHATTKGSCSICRKDICQQHTISEYNFGSDYPSKYCPNCWKIWDNGFKNKINILNEAHDQKISKLEEEFVKRCRDEK